MKHTKIVRTFSALALLIASLTACTDRFEQVVEIDLPEHESLLAVSTILLSNQVALPVLVSNSRGVLDTFGFNSFPDASVRLTKGGDEVGDFDYESPTSLFVAVLEDSLGNDPNTYTLEVAQKDYPTATATQQMPTMPQIGEVDINEDGTLVEGGGGRLDEIIVEIADQGGVDNYYAFRAYVEGVADGGPGEEPFEFSYPVSLYSNNPLAFESIFTDFTLLLDDGAFDGSVYPFNMYTFESLPFEEASFNDLKLRVELIALTEDAFLYIRSLEQYYQAEGNPFAEPVNVHNNIIQGYGVFGLGNVASKTQPLIE